MSYSVGSLVAARGREWVVLPDTDDEVLHVRPVGASNDEATGLLLSLEGSDIKPATFRPPTEQDVGDFRTSRLLRDALRLGFRSSAGPFRSFGSIAVTPRPYQLVPLLMALRMDPVRLLIADDVGIGKTVEALLVARELMDQGDITAMTVLCSPQLAAQWRDEMASKFHLDAKVVLPSTAKRLERNLALQESIFDRHPITVVSTDYIKMDSRRDEFLRTAPEFVIVDEAHTGVQADGGVRSTHHQRHELLKGLAGDPDRHLLLVTATPHSGKEDAFRALLELLDDSFADLPDDLTGAANEAQRRHVADHFVQRRRVDIANYLNEETTFPTRETNEVTYRLHNNYARLFDQAMDLARETVTDESGGKHRQRVRWWSALALLRSLASSPAAAAATLRTRAAAAEAESVDEADAIGRRTVLDQADDDASEGVDVPAGSDPDEPDESRLRRRLRRLATDAEALQGSKDNKLSGAVDMVTELLDDGFDPILFCRFIPTAEYVADGLRDALGSKATVAAVTGTLAPAEREARVEELGRADGPRVLVATDCMSEGINLQEHFDAVIHYDLSWNPTRHEQREGRVDRFGQAADTVRTVTYWGQDNRIDGIVLEVLLRKHQSIRNTLGVSVPVPTDTNRVVEAIMETIVTRDDGTQLPIEAVAEQQRAELFSTWEDAAEREKLSRTMFAQRTIHVDEVASQVAAMRRAIGSQDTVAEFMESAGHEWNAQVTELPAATTFDFTEAPRSVRDLLAPNFDLSFTADFEMPVEDGQVYLSRTHPIVQRLAQHIIDRAVDPQLDGIAARAGAMRTDAVTTRTTLLLVRFRFNLTQTVDGTQRPLLAEDARTLAFTGAPASPTWLSEDAAEALYEARPAGNVTPDQARRFVQRATEDWDPISTYLEDKADELADELLDQHRRVRDAADSTGSYAVTPHLPPDVLGLYVLLPGGGA